MNFTTSRPRGDFQDFGNNNWTMGHPLTKQNLTDMRKAGLKLNLKVPNGWMKINHWVPPHIDDFGQCFVYCHEGVGTLYVGDESNNLYAGETVIFDDAKTHFVMAEEPLTLMVCGLKS